MNSHWDACRDRYFSAETQSYHFVCKYMHNNSWNSFSVFNERQSVYVGWYRFQISVKKEAISSFLPPLLCTHCKLIFTVHRSLEWNIIMALGFQNATLDSPIKFSYFVWTAGFLINLIYRKLFVEVNQVMPSTWSHVIEI